MIAPPATRAEIVNQYRQLHQRSLLLWQGYDTATFLAPYGSAWSPAEHVRHLTKVMRAMARGLSLGRVKLWIAFGRADGISRSYETIRETYLAQLPSFSGTNPYAPSASAQITDAEAYRLEIMDRYQQALNNVLRATDRWQEAQLDRYRLPHPLLGKLTLREMLFFGLYHNLHHIERVSRRV